MQKKTEKLNMDKHGHKISGERLRIARHLKGYDLKDLAEQFKVNADTVAKWQMRGIPNNSLSMVAGYFEVEEWVFYDKNLNEHAFKEIINDPSLIDKYRPVERAIQKNPSKIFEYKKDNNSSSPICHSDPFLVSGDTVLIAASFWAARANSYLLITLINRDQEELYRSMRGGSAMRPKDPDMSVFLLEDRAVEEKISGQEFFRYLKPGYHYLSVYSKYPFEIAVYDIKAFPETT